MLDTNIPKFSGQLALHKLPPVSYFDYERLDFVFDAAEVSKGCTFSNSVHPTGPAGRLQGAEVDMRWTLFQRDSTTGVLEHQIGRYYAPAEYRITWSYNSKTQVGDSRLTPAPSVAPAASELLPKDVNNVLQAIKAHFSEAANKDTSLTPTSRIQLRSLMSGKFNLSAVVWRLATLWTMAGWVESTGSPLRSFAQTADLAPIMDAHSIDKYLTVLNSAYNQNIQPVCLVLPPDAVHTKEMLGLLRFVCMGSWQHSYTGDLPGVAVHLPAVGTATIVNCGGWPSNDCVPNIIDSHQVWDLAVMFCGQHGIVDQFVSAVNSVGLLWLSPNGLLSPIMQVEAIGMHIAPLNSAASLLLPLSQNATQWMMADTLAVEPDYAENLVARCSDSILLGCCVRLAGMLHNMPVAVYMTRAAPELHGYHKAFGRQGAHHTKIMCQSAQLARHLGASGQLGFSLASLTALFPDTNHLLKWWDSHDTAYQWEEVAYLLDSVPDNSGLCGVFDPLITTQVAVVNKWYGVANSIAARCSTPHAMQRLVYQNDVDVGVAVSAAADGSRQVYNYQLHTNYRGLYSDWLFFGPFMRKAAAAELIFRVVSGQSALTLASGPLGFDTRVFYVGKSDTDPDRDPDFGTDNLDFDLGGASSGAVPPGGGNAGSRLGGFGSDAPPSGGKGGGGLDWDDGDGDDPTTRGGVRVTSALAGTVASVPAVPVSDPAKVVRTARSATAAANLLDADYDQAMEILRAEEEARLAEARALERGATVGKLAAPPSWRGGNRAPEITHRPGVQLDAVSESGASSVSEGALSKATDKTDATHTQSELARRHKAKQVDLRMNPTYANVVAGFAPIKNPAQKIKWEAWAQTLLDSANPILVDFATRLPILFDRADSHSLHTDILKVVAPLAQSRLVEGLNTVPPASRASTARVVSNVLASIAEVAPPQAGGLLVNMSARWLAAHHAMAADPALQPNEVLAIIGRERWSQVKNPTSLIEAALEDGVSPASSFPIKYAVKGKDKRRVEWATRGDYADDVAHTRERAEQLRARIDERREKLGHNTLSPETVFTAAYGVETVHDAAIAKQQAVQSEGAAQSASAVADHTAALVAQSVAQSVSVSVVAPTVPKDMEDSVRSATAAAQTTGGAPNALDFESPSSVTSPLPGVGSANTGEGATFGVENTATGLSAANTVLPVPPPVGGRTMLTTLTSSLPSMGFGRPSKD